MTDLPEFDLLAKVSKALGRSAPSSQTPVPPEIPDSFTRLVQRDADLVQRFVQSAAAAQFKLQQLSAAELPARLVEFLGSQNCRRIGLAISPLLDRLKISKALSAAGLEIKSWSSLTLDESYDLDCGITDVFAVLAETGSLVIRPDPSQGRALSLVPPVHIAIVEKSNILPDMLDLFEKMDPNSPPPNLTLITGPSKTADIEGILFTGVHGPGLVQIFLIE